MINSFRRTNFISLKTLPNGALEYDLLLNNWDLFEINNPIQFNTIQVLDIQRPDYLSARIYRNVDYWWVLCKVNQIDDVWNDMYVGMDIIVPSVTDILEFHNRVRRRMRK